MRAFLETTFGPIEMAIIEKVYRKWLSDHDIPRESAEGELAAAITINLFREGHRTSEALERAVAGHRGLTDLKSLAD